MSTKIALTKCELIISLQVIFAYRHVVMLDGLAVRSRNHARHQFCMVLCRARR